MNNIYDELISYGPELIYNILSGKEHSNAWTKRHPKSKVGLPHTNSTMFDGIKYTYDENGFRTYPDYSPSTEKTVFCFGCENTFGKFLSDEDTWPLLVAKGLGNWKVKNFGCDGASIDSISRMCYQVMESINENEKPDVVFFLLPDFFREEYIGNINKSVIDLDLKLLDNPAPLVELKNLLGVTPDNIHSLNEAKLTSFYEYTTANYGFFTTGESMKLVEQCLLQKNIKWFWYSYFELFFVIHRKLLTNYIGPNSLYENDYLVNIFGDESPKLVKEDQLSVSNMFLNLYEKSDK